MILSVSSISLVIKWLRLRRFPYFYWHRLTTDRGNNSRARLPTDPILYDCSIGVVHVSFQRIITENFGAWLYHAYCALYLRLLSQDLLSLQVAFLVVNKSPV